jgi:hypothetical protein
MSVVSFPRAKHCEPGVWRASELDRLLPPCAVEIAEIGSNNGFAVGSTEEGDPQLYVLGPPPDYECVLCITRLGNLYVMEDGAGRIIFENTNLTLIAQQIPAAISRRKAAIAAKLTLLWMTLRQTFEEKIEPLLAEPLEFAAHISPQLAALA